MKRFILTGLLLILVAPFARAQDVIEIGRRHDARLPEWMRRELARNPNAFEFERAWKPDLEAARRVRAQLQSRGHLSMSLSPHEAARTGAAVSGAYSVPVIAISFRDTPREPYSSADLERRLYSDPSSLTLTKFYDEVSQGVFDLSGIVTDWVQADSAGAYYEGTDNGDQVGLLLKEALDQIDSTVDFSRFDGNRDGFVDFVAFVHPEAGGECGNDNIWSHRWVYQAWYGAPYQTNDGVYVSDYVIQPALNCDERTMIDIGVFAHEYGHALGLPDLYATNDSNGGIGVWGLMGAGNWNRPDSPSHLSAWSKVDLGWMPVVALSQSTDDIQIDPAETGGAAIRIDVPGAEGEYFLLENRQRLGSDQNLIAPGLLVWHVDSIAMARGRYYNSVNNDPSHKALELVEADGRYDMRGTESAGDPGDPFPGTSGRTMLGQCTDPNTSSHTGATSGVRLRNITDSGPSGSITLEFSLLGSTQRIWGDVTGGDGCITGSDLDLVLRRAIGAPVSETLEYGDVDGDGEVDARDALIIQSYIEGVDVSEFRIGDVTSH